MNIQSSARRRAVLGIYGVHRKPRGGSLSLRDLEGEWKATGLRRFDLQLALKDMTQRHWLRAECVDGHDYYELTFLGETAMQQVLAGGAATMVNDWLTLRHAKFRLLHTMPTSALQPKNRRTSDRFQHELGTAREPVSEGWQRGHAH